MNNSAQEIDVNSQQQSPPVAIGAIPRISIQAFCVTSEMCDATQRAANDRRLYKAHVNVQMGGIEKAVEVYKSTPTPNLLIVETNAPRDFVLAELNNLAQVCDAGTKVMVIGHINDVILYRELMNQGVSEYAVAPVGEVQLIEYIANLYGDPENSPVGRTYAFVGAKGGVGSSTISHNVGWAIAETFQEGVVVADFDVPFGTAGLNFNQDPPQGIAEALGAPDRLDAVMLDRLLTKCSEHLSLFASVGSIERQIDVEQNSVEKVIDTLKQSTPSVIIDLPHLWSPWVKHTLVTADEIIITAMPDLANLRNAKSIIDMLRSSRRNDVQPRLIINQVGTPKRPEISPDDFAKSLDLTPTLVLPFEPQIFGQAANNGQMINELRSNTKIAEGFQHLAQVVTNRTSVEEVKSSLLGPLLKKLRISKE